MRPAEEPSLAQRRLLALLAARGIRLSAATERDLAALLPRLEDYLARVRRALSAEQEPAVVFAPRRSEP